MNLMKTLGNTIKSILGAINTTATSVIPSAISTSHNLVVSAELASQTFVIESVISQEKDVITVLKDNPEVQTSRVNEKLAAMGLVGVTVPTINPISD